MIKIIQASFDKLLKLNVRLNKTFNYVFRVEYVLSCCEASVSPLCGSLRLTSSTCCVIFNEANRPSDQKGVRPCLKSIEGQSLELPLLLIGHKFLTVAICI